MAYVQINNPGNTHTGSLTVGGITNGGIVTGTVAPGYGAVPPTSSVTVPVTGAGILTTGSGLGAANSTVTINAHTHYPSVNIHQDGIDLSNSADIKFGGQSLKETLQAIQDRLGILVPDPVKMEKYAALKAAYEHYKMLERLCNEDD